MENDVAVKMNDNDLANSKGSGASADEVFYYFGYKAVKERI